MASYYDHKTHRVPRPTIVCDKQGVNDPHDNPSIAIDGGGYIWVFVSGRARVRPGQIFRSRLPLSIDEFELIEKREFTYPQPRWFDGIGFFHLFTKYTAGRELYWSTSADGREWTEDRKLAGFGGHYQVSGFHDRTIGTAFMCHPGGNVDKRTNLYYAQTTSFGRAWDTAGGKPLTTPIDSEKNDAMVMDYRARGLNVYIHDLNFDPRGRPVILYLTSKGAEPGPANGPRTWHIARWNGTLWDIGDVTESDHNYDTGSLYIERSRWVIVGPTGDGPQRWGTGGEMVRWTSGDEGKTWVTERQITHDSRFNYSYARRPVNARDPFYVFWADGNPNEFSESRLYFGDSTGKYWRLPVEMENDSAEPQPQ
jgi:hypothetical protein